MKSLKTAWRSISPLMLLLLPALLLLPLLCAAAGRETALPEAGYVCNAPEGNAETFCAALESMGFRQFPEEESLRAAVTEGTVDCGVVIPENISAALEGDCEHVLRWLSSPDALFPELRRTQAAAALFSAAAPYRTASALAPEGIDREEIFSDYFSELEGERSFRFQLETVSGKYRSEGERGLRYLMGALSLLLFTAISFGAALPLTEDTKMMARRIGLSSARRHILLPGIVLRCGLLLAASFAGCLIGGNADLIPATLQYVICIAAFSLLLAALPGCEWKTILLSLLSLAALALCPVFTDISLLLPGIARLRIFLPPWWLWSFARMDSGLLWLMIGAELLAFGAAELFLHKK